MKTNLRKCKRKRAILTAIDERNKQRKIQCLNCNHAHAIGELTAIQTPWHVPPRGEIGGDYWLEGEMQFVCPANGVVYRLLFDTDDVPWEERKKYENDPEAQTKNSNTNPYYASQYDLDKRALCSVWASLDI